MDLFIWFYNWWFAKQINEYKKLLASKLMEITYLINRYGPDSKEVQDFIEENKKCHEDFFSMALTSVSLAKERKSMCFRERITSNEDCYNLRGKHMICGETWSFYEKADYDSPVILNKDDSMPYRPCFPLVVFKCIGIRSDGLIKEFPDIVPAGQSGKFYNLEDGTIKELTL